MNRGQSPFLSVPRSDWVASNALAFSVWDAFPVSPGHALVIPHRLIPDWDAATPQEHQAILQLVDRVKRQLRATHDPDGFNLGINEGAAAGQTVFHLHIHIIAGRPFVSGLFTRGLR